MGSLKWNFWKVLRWGFIKCVLVLRILILFLMGVKSRLCLRVILMIFKFLILILRGFWILKFWCILWIVFLSGSIRFWILRILLILFLIWCWVFLLFIVCWVLMGSFWIFKRMFFVVLMKLFLIWRWVLIMVFFLLLWSVSICSSRYRNWFRWAKWCWILKWRVWMGKNMCCLIFVGRLFCLIFG